MTSVQAAKKLLRTQMKKKLAALSKEHICLESEKLTLKFVSHPVYVKSQRIAVYPSMADEVQTEGILRSIFSLGKTCFIPRYSTKSSHMDMLRLHSMDDIKNLEVTKWNVLQPSDSDNRENALKTGGLDLVLVPGLAFTQDCKRMGRGKGYYDTFLRCCQEIQEVPPVCIALALSPQVVPDIPTSEHDFSINQVISLDDC